MTSNKDTNLIDEDVNESEESIVEILSKESRFMIFLYLLSYPELDLGELSKRIGKSKSTIHRDLQLLIKIGVVNELRQDFSTKSKFYALNPKFIFEDLKELQSADHLAKMNSEQRRRYFEFIVRTTRNAFFVLENSINLTFRYLDYFEDLKKDLSIPDLDTLSRWSQELGVGIRIVPLSDKTFPVYVKHYSKFAEELNKELYEVQEQGEILGGEYLIWHVILPLRKILR